MIFLDSISGLCEGVACLGEEQEQQEQGGSRRPPRDGSVMAAPASVGT